MSAPTPSAITAIVPARNEEQSIETCVRSLAAQPEIAEIRVVNDGSSDRTAEILARLAAEIPRLRVIDAGPLPDGWVGKNHAAWLGAQDSTTDWLLFTDADVRHLPGSAAHALANGELRGAALVSYSPQQRLETWWERAMIPFVFSRLALRYPYKKVNDPRSRIAAANGQYLMIRRDAYGSIGGHRAIAAEVLEDVALARRAKAAGFTLHFVPGVTIAETRMYRTFAAMWEGWTKNLYPLNGASPLALVAELVCVLPILEFTVLYFLVLSRLPSQGFNWGIWVAFAGMVLNRAGFFYRDQTPPENQSSASGISWWYWPLGLPLYCTALTVSAWRHATGAVAWKGRTYQVGS